MSELNLLKKAIDIANQKTLGIKNYIYYPIVCSIALITGGIIGCNLDGFTSKPSCVPTNVEEPTAETTYGHLTKCLTNQGLGNVTFSTTPETDANLAKTELKLTPKEAEALVTYKVIGGGNVDKKITDQMIQTAKIKKGLGAGDRVQIANIENFPENKFVVVKILN